MIKHVETVLIGKAFPASYTTADALTAGDVAVFDESGKLLKTAAEAASAKELYIGVAGEKVQVTMPNGSIEEKANIEMSPVIKKDMKPSVTMSDYVAPVKDSIEIDFTSASIVAGNRYVLRIIYKDIYEHPGQFSHTYEVFATSTTATDLANAFMKEINNHKNRRVSAAVSSAKLTLTALDKNDNEGVNSVNEYTVVDMDATVYVTEPSALLGNIPSKVNGLTITKTQGNPGKGYWKQVRDAEIRNMGYKGQVFTDAYPAIEQDRKVVKGAEYGNITVEYDNLYLSNDNQYIKTTPMAINLYVANAGTVSDSIVAQSINAFIKGSAE